MYRFLDGTVSPNSLIWRLAILGSCVAGIALLPSRVGPPPGIRQVPTGNAAVVSSSQVTETMTFDYCATSTNGQCTLWDPPSGSF